MPEILRVALKAPLHELFDYLPPDGNPVPAVGQRVTVPFGRSRRTGIIAALADASDIAPERLKQALQIIDAEPLLDAPLIELLNWAAAYYQHPPGDVYAAALPATLRKGGAAAPQSQDCFRITNAGQAGLATIKAPVQKTILSALSLAPDGLTATECAGIHAGWQRAMRELRKKDFAEKFSRPVEQPDHSERELRPARTLNEDQQQAVNAIEAGGGTTWLLEGVTGSGKTEVYLKLIERQLTLGKQSLVIVPEIGLTPQLVARFTERLATRVALLHSNLNDSERLQAWLDTQDGSAGVIIGTRSAIFAPLKNPGLIVIDEEHDASLKQQEGFRYSARDLAVFRANQLRIPCVLGSATPSFETLANTQAGRYQHVKLPVRAGGASQPSVHLIDLQRNPATDGLTQPMVAAITRHLDANGQVLLYLNRRGYAPTLFSSETGTCVECPRCDARLVVHQKIDRAICHHCGFEARLEDVRNQYDGELYPLGQGTERIEAALNRLFPEQPVVRLDRDSTRRKGSLEKALNEIRSGEARILLGTQMLTKGHDFPNVTLVCILDADQGLFGTDFRAGERLAQNFIQVAGRAGRGDRSGEVWIQTLYPENPQLQTLLNEGYSGFAAAGLQERRETSWPPFSHLALLRAECGNKDVLYQVLERAKQSLTTFAHQDIGILGPASAPMERRSGRWRAQILLQAGHRPTLQATLKEWRQQLAAMPEARKIRWSIDVDPIELF